MKSPVCIRFKFRLSTKFINLAWNNQPEWTCDCSAQCEFSFISKFGAVLKIERSPHEHVARTKKGFLKGYLWTWWISKSSKTCQSNWFTQDPIIKYYMVRWVFPHLVVKKYAPPMGNQQKKTGLGGFKFQSHPTRRFASPWARQRSLASRKRHWPRSGGVKTPWVCVWPFKGGPLIKCKYLRNLQQDPLNGPLTLSI